MPRINIDGTDYEAAAGHNLLQACLSLGFNLPISAGIRRWDRSARAASAR